VAPVMRAVPSGSHTGGMVSTILPMFLAWLRKRKASGASRMSQERTGIGPSAPRSKRSTRARRISWYRSGWCSAIWIRSNAP